jgi:hypothetical protein
MLSRLLDGAGFSRLKSERLSWEEDPAVAQEWEA